MKLKERVGLLLKQTQQNLRSALDEALRKHNLTTPQYAVLAVLEQNPNLSNADLARKVLVTPQTMNFIVTNLETAGLIERHRHPVYKRVLQYILTPKGRTLVSQCHQCVEEIEECMLKNLSQSEQEQLIDLLSQCRAGLQEILPKGVD